MDERMFGKGKAPWDDPEASESEFDSDDSECTSDKEVKRVETPEYQKVI